ncbi:hypothetical protein PCIT_a2597 [Pseudoalteromonas citrea]|uniref:Uncharacterized protein n=1 Tax=Pseudoalteromonas citrea TaxID=43655 RepID=A0AAD4AH97_9GAMM|nr:hypothetical protein PCIT_a2597 [Pseudoalteromonas citrea]
MIACKDYYVSQTVLGHIDWLNFKQKNLKIKVPIFHKHNKKTPIEP